MALRTILTTIVGLLGLQQYESDFAPTGIGSPKLTRSEKAIMESVDSIIARLQGPSGTVANFTYTVATLAARPAVNTVPDGTLVFVESQKSWYWTDLASNTYRRVVQPNPAWMAQAAWGIDTTNGSDENDGSVANPLLTANELFARLPAINQSTTVTVAAGSALGRFTWQPVVQNGTAGVTVTVQGVRALGANHLVATSSDETATLTPRVDAGVALTVGSLIQATTGVTANATAVVAALVSGTNYATSPWRAANGGRVAPPAAGANIAAITLPSTTFWSLTITGGVNVSIASNLAISSIDDVQTQFQRFNTCTVSSGLFLSEGFYTFDGTGINQGASQNTIFGTPGTFFTLGAFVGSGVTAFDQTVNATCDNMVVLGGGALIIRDNGYINITRVGIIGSNTDGLQVVRGAFARINGTLYGSGNASYGTRVNSGATVGVNPAVTPTLGGASELLFDEQTTGIPALVGGTNVPNVSALTTWAQWAGAPFNRSVIGLQGQAGQASGARIIGS